MFLVQDDDIVFKKTVRRHRAVHESKTSWLLVPKRKWLHRPRRPESLPLQLEQIDANPTDPDSRYPTVSLLVLYELLEPLTWSSG